MKIINEKQNNFTHLMGELTHRNNTTTKKINKNTKSILIELWSVFIDYFDIQTFCRTFFSYIFEAS